MNEGDLPYSLRFCLERMRESLEVIGPAASDGPGPLEILARLDEQFGDGAQVGGDRQHVQPRDLLKVGELFRAFHDALEGSYAFRASDA